MQVLTAELGSDVVLAPLHRELWGHPVFSVRTNIPHARLLDQAEFVISSTHRSFLAPVPQGWEISDIRGNTLRFRSSVHPGLSVLMAYNARYPAGVALQEQADGTHRLLPAATLQLLEIRESAPVDLSFLSRIGDEAGDEPQGPELDLGSWFIQVNGLVIRDHAFTLDTQPYVMLNPGLNQMLQGNGMGFRLPATALLVVSNPYADNHESSLVLFPVEADRDNQYWLYRPQTSRMDIRIRDERISIVAGDLLNLEGKKALRYYTNQGVSAANLAGEYHQADQQTYVVQDNPEVLHVVTAVANRVTEAIENLRSLGFPQVFSQSVVYDNVSTLATLTVTADLPDVQLLQAELNGEKTLIDYAGFWFMTSQVGMTPQQCLPARCGDVLSKNGHAFVVVERWDNGVVLVSLENSSTQHFWYNSQLDAKVWQQETVPAFWLPEQKVLAISANDRFLIFSKRSKGRMIPARYGQPLPETAIPLSRDQVWQVLDAGCEGRNYRGGWSFYPRALINPYNDAAALRQFLDSNGIGYTRRAAPGYFLKQAGLRVNQPAPVWQLKFQGSQPQAPEAGTANRVLNLGNDYPQVLKVSATQPMIETNIQSNRFFSQSQPTIDTELLNDYYTWSGLEKPDQTTYARQQALLLTAIA